jgi:LIM domain-containing protein
MAGTGGGGTAHSMLKPLLPFSVTPPRQNGPSEAERKIEALTKQLEEELEMEEESEYFGETNFECKHLAA